MEFRPSSESEFLVSTPPASWWDMHLVQARAGTAEDDLEDIDLPVITTFGTIAR